METLLGVSFCLDLVIDLFSDKDRHSGLEMLSHKSFFVRVLHILKHHLFTIF